MYRKDDANQLRFEDFYLPFNGKLRSDNRWIVLSGQIPWQQIEQAYSGLFSNSKVGCPAKSARIARVRLSSRNVLAQPIVRRGCR